MISITALPEGYASQLGERGARLSGGQRQRIAIARAVLKNRQYYCWMKQPEALIPKANRFDSGSVRDIAQIPHDPVIAHRLSTVQGADRIIVLEDGHIVETGRHDHLSRLMAFMPGWRRSSFRD